MTNLDEETTDTPGERADWLLRWLNENQATMNHEERMEAIAAAQVHATLSLVKPAKPERELLAEVWNQGMKFGASRALRHMSDEPNLPLASEKDNPYA